MDEFLVFVDVGESVEQQKPLKAVVRLAPLNHCDVFGLRCLRNLGMSLEFLSGVESIGTVELLPAPSVQPSQYEHDVIQCARA